ncbi:MAG: riboflavin biosynthesis protein RibF [Burkholderiales bacterium]
MDRVHVCNFDAAFSSLSAQHFIEQVVHRGLGAQWLIIGHDFHFGAKRQGNVALMKKAGRELDFEVEIMQAVTLGTQRVSSSAVRAALARGDLTMAEKFLGRHYSISGHVVHGNKTGRELGFPTANVQLKHPPALAGIYAVEFLVDNVKHHAVASLGTRPTMVSGGEPVLEVYIFDFDRDIYGGHVKVDFLHKLRDEEKYPDRAALVAQITKDVADARMFFRQRDSGVQISRA